MSDRYDIAIIGGGPVGAALALALRGSGLAAAMLEAREDPAAAADPRALAVSWGSRLILERLGVWRGISATAIRCIHVSTKGSFGRAVLGAEECGVPDLGYVVSYRGLYRALHEALAASGVDYLTGAEVSEVDCGPESGRFAFRRGGEARHASAQLVVLADGGRLAQTVRGVERSEREYGQWAVVAEVRTDRAHGNVAYERFTSTGPVALLPQGEGYALVWTATPVEAQELIALEDAEFMRRLQEHFGGRAGRFVEAGPRAGFPLALRETEARGVPRLALLGNAAHTLHPVAGQGFNLGLRDAWELADLLLRRRGADPGSASLLREFRARRRLDTEGGILFTDSLVRVFSNSLPGLAVARGAALTALDLLPPAKRFLARRMIFGARA